MIFETFKIAFISIDHSKEALLCKTNARATANRIEGAARLMILMLYAWKGLYA